MSKARLLWRDVTGVPNAYVNDTGRAKNPQSMALYIGKYTDIRPAKLTADEFHWLFIAMKKTRSYQPRGPYRAFLSALKANKLKVAGSLRAPVIRKVNDNAIHASTSREREEDAGREKDGEMPVFPSVNRMLATCTSRYIARYATSGVVVAGYDPNIPKIGGSERMCDIEGKLSAMEAAFYSNAPNVDIARMMAEEKAANELSYKLSNDGITLPETAKEFSSSRIALEYELLIQKYIPLYESLRKLRAQAAHFDEQEHPDCGPEAGEICAGMPEYLPRFPDEFQGM
jgi:hypothetical protein